MNTRDIINSIKYAEIYLERAAKIKFYPHKDNCECADAFDLARGELESLREKLCKAEDGTYSVRIACSNTMYKETPKEAYYDMPSDEMVESANKEMS